MELKLPYNKGEIPLQVDEGRILAVVEPNDVPPVDEGTVIARGLENYSGPESLDQFLSGCDHLLIIVNDGTRPTPTARVLKQLSTRFEGIDVRFIIATGVHRGPTEEEYRFIFGDLYDLYRHKAVAHDARNDEMVYLGTSANGTVMRINKEVTLYDKVLIIGSVEPHYFAGYTGGRKSFLPGVASYQTIEMNHKHALDQRARALKLAGNPVHEDMIDALKTLKCDVFSIQAVLDKNHRIYGLTSGDINESFFKAINIAEEIFVASIREKADIVITVAGYPMDVDLYQSQKAIDNGKLALKEGGILILLSACREGLGEEAFFKLLSSSQTPEEVLQSIRENYVLGYHKAGKMAEINIWASVRVVSELDDGLWRKIFIEPESNLQKALDRALEEKGPEARVIIMKDGCMTVPKIEDEKWINSKNRLSPITI